MPVWLSEDEYATRTGGDPVAQEHCTSCHEDEALGYIDALIELWGDDGDPGLEPGERVRVCCYVSREAFARWRARR